MQLASFLHAQDVVIEQRVLNKTQVYQHLVDRICRNHKLPICGNNLLEMILKRDEEVSTAYSTGIAIPHIRMEGFEDTVVAMTFLQNPLDYEGIKVSWVVLIITDKASSKLYLNMVATLLKLSRDKEVFNLLAASQDGAAVIHHLKNLAVKIKEDLCIADIMISNPISTQPDALLSDLGRLMSEHGISVMPVTDSENRFLGEVNILHLLKVGVPDYLMMLDNINFLQSFEPLENLFEKQDTVKVKEIMHDDELTIGSSASVIEAVFEMILRGKRLLSVVDDGILVGVVTAMDVYRKVVKA